VRRKPDVTPRRFCATTVDAETVEGDIWADVEQFIRNPSATLLLLHEQHDAEQLSAEKGRTALAETQQDLDAQQAERDAVLALFRKGRISERDLNRQLDQIAEQEATILAKRDTQLAALTAATARAERAQNARALLQRLHARLDDEPLTAELKREIVETLVQEIRVKTVEVGISVRGRVKQDWQVHVTYCFDEPTEPETGTDDTLQALHIVSTPRR
jgi:hypothetical protein